MLTSEKWRYAFWWLTERILRALRLVINYATMPIAFWFIAPHGPQFRVQIMIIATVSIVGGILGDVLRELSAIESGLERLTRDLERLKWRSK